MAIDFITGLCSGVGDFPSAFIAVDTALRQFNAERNEVYREDIEGIDQRFQDGQSTGAAGVPVISADLADWRGASTVYRTRDFRFELLMFHWSVGGLNAFVRVDMRELRRLRNNQQLKQHDSVLVIISRALQSYGGLGRVELDMDPIAPEQLGSMIFESSRFALAAPALAILSSLKFGHDDLSLRSEKKYSMQTIDGFYVLKGSDYPEPTS